MAEKVKCDCALCDCDELTWNADKCCTPCKKGIHWYEADSEG